jgi:hypothetical protein
MRIFARLHLSEPIRLDKEPEPFRFNRNAKESRFDEIGLS